MSPMVLENDVEVGESLPPATEHVGQRELILRGHAKLT
jgi:hypothetical protein